MKGEYLGDQFPTFPKGDPDEKVSQDRSSRSDTAKDRRKAEETKEEETVSEVK